jgi:hypothetical protein
VLSVAERVYKGVVQLSPDNWAYTITIDGQERQMDGEPNARSAADCYDARMRSTRCRVVNTVLYRFEVQAVAGEDDETTLQRHYQARAAARPARPPKPPPAHPLYKGVQQTAPTDFTVIAYVCMTRKRLGVYKTAEQAAGVYDTEMRRQGILAVNFPRLGTREYKAVPDAADDASPPARPAAMAAAPVPHSPDELAAAAQVAAPLLARLRQEDAREQQLPRAPPPAVKPQKVAKPAPVLASHRAAAAAAAALQPPQELRVDDDVTPDDDDAMPYDDDDDAAPVDDGEAPGDNDAAPGDAALADVSGGGSGLSRRQRRPRGYYSALMSSPGQPTDMRCESCKTQRKGVCGTASASLQPAVCCGVHRGLDVNQLDATQKRSQLISRIFRRCRHYAHRRRGALERLQQRELVASALQAQQLARQVQAHERLVRRAAQRVAQRSHRQAGVALSCRQRGIEVAKRRRDAALGARNARRMLRGAVNEVSSRVRVHASSAGCVLRGWLVDKRRLCSKRRVVPREGPAQSRVALPSRRASQQHRGSRARASRRASAAHTAGHARRSLHPRPLCANDAASSRAAAPAPSRRRGMMPRREARRAVMARAPRRVRLRQGASACTALPLLLALLLFLCGVAGAWRCDVQRVKAGADVASQGNKRLLRLRHRPRPLRPSRPRRRRRLRRLRCLRPSRLCRHCLRLRLRHRRCHRRRLQARRFHPVRLRPRLRPRPLRLRRPSRLRRLLRRLRRRPSPPGRARRLRSRLLRLPRHRGRAPQS